jgi:hypothetical protein
VKPGERRKPRHAYRTSWKSDSIRPKLVMR